MDLEFLCFNFINEFFYLGRGRSSIAKNEHHLQPSVGIIANMAAQRITAIKNINPDGSILEIVIWKVPKPVPPTEHGFKYRAVYVLDGVRIVGFDNERGKGDHCHLDGKELPYTFTSVDQLLEDFIAAVETRRAS